MVMQMEMGAVQVCGYLSSPPPSALSSSPSRASLSLSLAMVGVLARLQCNYRGLMLGCMRLSDVPVKVRFSIM